MSVLSCEIRSPFTWTSQVRRGPQRVSGHVGINSGALYVGLGARIVGADLRDCYQALNQSRSSAHTWMDAGICVRAFMLVVCSRLKS